MRSFNRFFLTISVVYLLAMLFSTMTRANELENYHGRNRMRLLNKLLMREYLFNSLKNNGDEDGAEQLSKTEAFANNQNNNNNNNVYDYDGSFGGVSENKEDSGEFRSVLPRKLEALQRLKMLGDESAMATVQGGYQGDELLENDERQLLTKSGGIGRDAQKLARLMKLLNYLPNKNKKGFHIQTQYQVLTDNGSIVLVPKENNKNHYFIG